MNHKTHKPTTIAEYIQAASPEAQQPLREMLACLKKAAPEAEEAIKWGAPTLSYHRILFAFAAFKNHLSLMPTPSAMKAFEKELKNFKTGKGSIQFPLGEPLPLDLIQKIAAFRVKESIEKDVRWM